MNENNFNSTIRNKMKLEFLISIIVMALMCSCNRHNFTIIKQNDISTFKRGMPRSKIADLEEFNRNNVAHYIEVQSDGKDYTVYPVAINNKAYGERQGREHVSDVSWTPYFNEMYLVFSSDDRLVYVGYLYSFKLAENKILNQFALDLEKKLVEYIEENKEDED